MKSAKVMFQLVLSATFLAAVASLAGCGGGASCVEGLILCGNSCADLTKDPLNCGACNTACGVAQTCDNSKCTDVCKQTLCGDECVNVKTDPRHCGTCDKACEPGQVCQLGKCITQCEEPFKLCGDSCVAVKSDPKNCGDCAVECRADQTCADGKCACTGSFTECGGKCVDTNTDPTNCGGCGQQCKAGELCAAGKCTSKCDPPLTECNGACVDPASDPKNCGSCGKTCQNNQQCISGNCGCANPDKYIRCPDTEAGVCVEKGSVNNCGNCETVCKIDQHEVCVCTGGQCACQSSCPESKPVDCGGTCTNTKTDPKNCGACGNVCREDQVCSAGKCACPTGKTDCSGRCIDTNTDNDNCGRCGNKCADSELCSSGSCVKAVVESVSVSCDKYELRVREETTCKATATLSNGKTKDVTKDPNTGWVSGDAVILEVRDTLTTKGQIRGLAIGNTYVRVILRADGNLQAQHDIRVVNNCLSGVEIVAPHPPDHTLPGVVGLKWRFYLRGKYENGETAILLPDPAQTSVWDTDNATVLSFASSFGTNNKRDGVGYVVAVGKSVNVKAHWRENNQGGSGCDTSKEFDAPEVKVTIRPSDSLAKLVFQPERGEAPMGAAACFRVLYEYGSDGYQVDVTDSQGWGLGKQDDDGYTWLDDPDEPFPTDAPNQPAYAVTQNGPGEDPLNPKSYPPGHILCGDIPGGDQQLCDSGRYNFYLRSIPDAARPQVCIFTNNTTGANFTDIQLGKIRGHEADAGTAREGFAYVKVGSAVLESCEVHTPQWYRSGGFAGGEEFPVVPTGHTQPFGIALVNSDGWWQWYDPREPIPGINVAWNSSNSSVLEVSGQGTGTGRAAGTADVLATVNDLACKKLPMTVADAALQDLFVVQTWHGSEEEIAFTARLGSGGVTPADCSFETYEYNMSQNWVVPLARPFGEQYEVEPEELDPPPYWYVFWGLYSNWYGLLPNEQEMSLSYRAVAAFGLELGGQVYCIFEDKTADSDWTLVAPKQLNRGGWDVGPAYPPSVARGGITLGNTAGQKGVATAVFNDSAALHRVDGIQAKYRDFTSTNSIAVEVCGRKDRTSPGSYVLAFPLYSYHPAFDPIEIGGNQGGAYWDTPVELTIGGDIQLIAMARVNVPSGSEPCYHARRTMYYIDVTDQAEWAKVPGTATNVVVGNQGAVKGVVVGAAEGDDGGVQATYEGTKKSNTVPFNVLGPQIVAVVSVSPSNATLHRVRPALADPADANSPDGRRWMGELQQFTARVLLDDGTEVDVTERPDLFWMAVDPDTTEDSPCAAIDQRRGLLEATNFRSNDRCTAAVMAFAVSSFSYKSALVVIEDAVLDDTTPLFVTTQDRTCLDTPPSEVPAYFWNDGGDHFTTIKLHACLNFKQPKGAVVDLDRFRNSKLVEWQSLNTACMDAIGATRADTMGEFVPVDTGCEAALQAVYSAGATRLQANLKAVVKDKEIIGLELSSLRNYNGATLGSGCNNNHHGKAQVCLLKQQTDQLAVRPILEGNTTAESEVITYSKCLTFSSSTSGILKLGNYNSTDAPWTNGFVTTSGDTDVGFRTLKVEGRASQADLDCALDELSQTVGVYVATTEADLKLFTLTSQPSTASAGGAVRFPAQYRATFHGGSAVTVDVSNDVLCTIRDGVIGLALFSSPTMDTEVVDPSYVSSPWWSNCSGLARPVSAATQVSVAARWPNGGTPVAANPPLTVNP